MTKKPHTKYTDEMASKICELIASGAPLTGICKTDGFPALRTVHYWLQKNTDFRTMMVNARQDQADTHADQMLELLDQIDGDPKNANAYRVKADILRWQASVRAPRKYGELIRQELVKPADSMTPSEATEEIKRLEEKLGINQHAPAAPRSIN